MNEVTDQLDIERLTETIESMRSQLVSSSTQQALAYNSEFEGIFRWVTSIDLLQHAGITGKERRYVDLLAWLISPATWGEKIALEIQQTWLSSLSVHEIMSIDSPAIPFVEEEVGSGRIDLILHYPQKLIIGVEAKTGSTEHPTGTDSDLQTTHYAKNIHSAVKEAISTPSKIIYLTRNRSVADNPESILTSYFDVAVSIANLMSPADVPADLRSALSIVLTHYIDSNRRNPRLTCSISELSTINSELLKGDPGVETALDFRVEAENLSSLLSNKSAAGLSAKKSRSQKGKKSWKERRFDGDFSETAIAYAQKYEIVERLGIPSAKSGGGKSQAESDSGLKLIAHYKSSYLDEMAGFLNEIRFNVQANLNGQLAHSWGNPSSDQWYLWVATALKPKSPFCAYAVIHKSARASILSEGSLQVSVRPDTHTDPILRDQIKEIEQQYRNLLIVDPASSPLDLFSIKFELDRSDLIGSASKHLQELTGALTEVTGYN